MNRSNDGDFNRTIGADFLQLNTADAPVGGLADWLTDQLRTAISDGRLAIGSRLPATRLLAAELQISRGVVTEAYQRLTEDGQLSGRGRAGTIVVAAPAVAPAPVRLRSLPPQMRAPGLDIFVELRAAPARIDLTPGVPDLASFPRAAWLRSERAVLNNLEPAAFGYGDPAGTPALRQAVSTWLARYRGITVHPEEVVIVAGVSQAIGMLAQLLQARGLDTVAVEDPSSLGSRQHLEEWGLRTPPIPVDSSGLRVDALRESGAPVVMVTPAHQFPTGVVLEGERRRDLLQWAADGGLIFEDDYDAEHRYDRPPVPALRSMQADQVLYAGSVSKLLAPALRIGWIVPPAQYRDELISLKRRADLGNASLPQLTLAHLMNSGELERQLRYVQPRPGSSRPIWWAHPSACGFHPRGQVQNPPPRGSTHRVRRGNTGNAQPPRPARALARVTRPIWWAGPRGCGWANRMQLAHPHADGWTHQIGYGGGTSDCR
ncbi:PLP-dependent aminotransferase family protein [Kribbella antibiotica]|uniref:PLP-dependent aminotransferase family protein n=1 Tax=Kribbella antibiotica TaxID=190195 RepID=A0A4R4ZHZ4_9ACTN|nr:PLP-dependent aminotransferase family protein [Kribbella antibiotica]TDD57119.1 PLP-dependent aminotransferase family protein [Kribbella antibiotica]